MFQQTLINMKQGKVIVIVYILIELLWNMDEDKTRNRKEFTEEFMKKQNIYSSYEIYTMEHRSNRTTSTTNLQHTLKILLEVIKNKIKEYQRSIPYYNRKRIISVL